MDDIIHRINERDLFNYIFFKDKLSVEKRIFLFENLDKYGQILFYKKLKENLMLNVDKTIKEKLAERISAYKKSPQIFTLFPVEIDIPQKPQEMPVLAAASVKEYPKVTAKSFMDEDKTFVIRLVKIGKKTKIYPFPLLINESQKLKLTLHPSEKTYTVDSDKHIELDLIDEIESVSVEEMI